MHLLRRKRVPSVEMQVLDPSRALARNHVRTELADIGAGFTGRYRQNGGSGALTAAGMLVKHNQPSLLRRLIMPWQIRALGYYDILGEIKYAAQFYSRSISNLELFAAVRDPETGEIERTEEPDVVAALERIKDPGGTSRSGLLAAYGRLMFLTGEAYLFVTRDHETGLEQWEVLSTDELRIIDGSYTRFQAPSLPATSFRPAADDDYFPVKDDTAVAYRVWRRHPRYSMLPDSTMAGVLDICEELVLLTQAVRARARSRIANSGVLFIDQRITAKPMEALPDEDPNLDPFIAALVEAATAPIVDEGTAAAQIPIVARVTVPDGQVLGDLIHLLRITEPTQQGFYAETGLRSECIRRLAIGLDMPPEILLGITDSNHWSAWLVDEQVWKAHLQPVCQQLVDDLTSAYLAPYLRDKVGKKDWQQYCVAYDAAAIINHPDRTKDAKDLFDRVAIGHAALREAAGFDDSDAPNKEERAEIIGIKTRDSSLAWYGTPSVRGGGIEPSPGVLVKAGQEPVSAPDTSQGAEVAKEPPASGPPSEQDGDGGGNEVVASADVHVVAGCAHVALFRAREIAGARVRSAAARDPELLALIDGIENRDVCATLGRDRVRGAARGATDTQLVEKARPLLLDSVLAGGVPTPVAAAVADTVVRHAARTLYDRDARLPDGFPAYVDGLLLGGRNGRQ